MTPADQLKAKMADFKLSVVCLPCAGCGRLNGQYASWPAHHVIYRQHLPVELEWDARNAMPLCIRCHEAHHGASKRVSRAALTETHWEFAREVLGEAAPYYIDRRYSSSSTA